MDIPTRETAASGLVIPRIQNSDVLDIPADALVYSTNVLLNCSGGVGACLAQRYGPQVQKDLHAILHRQGSRFAEHGSVIGHVTGGLPYKAVFHTVPSDGFYFTTEEIVTGVLRRAFQGCVETPGVRTVVFSAIATGYGKMEFADFMRIASKVVSDPALDSLATITLGIADPFTFGLAADQIAAEGLNFQVE